MEFSVTGDLIICLISFRGFDSNSDFCQHTGAVIATKTAYNYTIKITVRGVSL